MNINKDIRNILLVGIFGCAVFFGGVLMLLNAFASVNETLDKRDVSLSLARESSENSFGLTNNVRNYIASGKMAFMDAYNEILDIRSGKKPRPVTREVAPGETATLNDLFRRAGFTREEEELLNRANQLSGALAVIEVETVNLFENARPEELEAARSQALQMLYGDDYTKAAAEIQTPVREFETKLRARLAAEVEKVEADFTLVGRILLGLIVLAAILLVGIIWWLKRRVLGTIGNIAFALDETSAAVNLASNQIAENSRNVSESAASQASSLAEASSALEELASMTRQNAENAEKTNETTKATLSAIATGSQAVAEMNESMNEINESSEQISRIIKTIEEIAFQTNLLALNAAVEAARAGESGKGFAVVADEVRNLAQRSAQAARDTAALIVTTVDRVKRGAGTASRLAEDFREVEDKSRIIGELIQSITVATEEQSRGMEQINETVSQMDKQTQDTAANSHETAEASQQLTGQAATLNRMTAEIMAVIGKTRERADAFGEHVPVKIRENGANRKQGKMKQLDYTR